MILATIRILFGALLAAMLWWPAEVYAGGKEILSAGFFLALILAVIRGGRDPEVRESRRLPGVLLAVAIFFLWLAVATVLGVDAYRSAEVLLGLSAVMALAAGIVLAGDDRLPRKLETVILCVVAALCARGAYQYVYVMRHVVTDAGAWGGLTSQELLPALSRMSSGRIYSRFALPSTFSCVLLAALPLVHRRIRESDSPIRYVALLAGMTLCLTLARAHAALLLFCVYWMADLWARKPSYRLRIAAAGLVAVGAIAFLMRPDALFRMSDPANPIRLRLDNWAVAFSEFLSSPWTGVGPGNFGLLFGAHSSGLTATRYAHGIQMTVLAETGIIGAVLWVWLAILFGKWVAETASPFRTGAGLVGLYSLVDIVLELPSQQALVCCLIGLALRDELGSRVMPKALRIGAGVFAAAGLCLCMALYAANTARDDGMEILQAQRMSVDDLRRAEKQFERAYTLWPSSGTASALGHVQVLLASASGDAAGYRRARDYFSAAVEKSPASAHIRGRLGQTHLALGDTAAAATQFREAAKLDPRGPYMEQYLKLMLEEATDRSRYVGRTF